MEKLRTACYSLGVVILLTIIVKLSVVFFDWFHYRDADDLPYETVDKPITKDQIRKEFRRLPEPEPK